MTERFELVSELGRGGMGVVWKARDREAGEFVALKLLNELYRDDAGYVERFEREVDIARRIASVHVVGVRGYGLFGGTPFVAMEYVEGRTLSQQLREFGPMPWERARVVLLHVTRGLAAAHLSGVIHRDIKPSNILLDARGQAKLADFGIARALDLTRLTGTATMMGTPAYMSPDGDASEQSDLYALGCVLYEMLTGGPPFTGQTQQQIVLKHIREQPNLEKLPKGEARRIAGWLLEKAPEKRCASAEALIGQLERHGGRGRGELVVFEERPVVAASADVMAQPSAEGRVGVAVEPEPLSEDGAAGHPRLRAARSAAQAVVMMALCGGAIWLLARSGAGDSAAASSPTPAPAPPFAAGVTSLAPPGPPVITAFSWDPPDGELGGSVTVSMQFGDPNGDATTVEVATTGGSATWFGTDSLVVVLPTETTRQMRNEATWTQLLQCGPVPFDTKLSYTVIDATGARSNTAVAAFKCQ